jgi:hypothetical protein
MATLRRLLAAFADLLKAPSEPPPRKWIGAAGPAHLTDKG